MTTRAHYTTTPQRVSTLAAADVEAMYQVMCAHFENVDRGQFERDLLEKTWVYRVTEQSSGRLAGFSTMVPLVTEVDGQTISAMFSGDTVLEPACWGDRQFVRVVGRHLFDLAAEMPAGPVYWLLLTCTYRSYRFLPGFYLEYWPRADRPMPPEVARRLEALVRLKFPDQYDASRGVVALDQQTPVRDGRAEIPARQLEDPHVAFFLRANPGYARGDFLACLTEHSPSNVNALGRRLWGL